LSLVDGKIARGGSQSVNERRVGVFSEKIVSLPYVFRQVVDRVGGKLLMGNGLE
jgi:hypothetical protein